MVMSLSQKTKPQSRAPGVCLITDLEVGEGLGLPAPWQAAFLGPFPGLRPSFFPFSLLEERTNVIVTIIIKVSFNINVGTPRLCKNYRNGVGPLHSRLRRQRAHPSIWAPGAQGREKGAFVFRAVAPRPAAFRGHIVLRARRRQKQIGSGRRAGRGDPSSGGSGSLGSGRVGGPAPPSPLPATPSPLPPPRLSLQGPCFPKAQPTARPIHGSASRLGLLHPPPLGSPPPSMALLLLQAPQDPIRPHPCAAR